MLGRPYFFAHAQPPFQRGALLGTIIFNINREGGNMTNPGLHISTQPPYFAGYPIGFSGWADDFERNIAAIQFSLDGGEHWTEYATPGVSAERGIRWQFAFTPPRAGRYLLNVRTRNGSGSVSDLVSGYPFEVYEAPAPSIGENSQSRHEEPSEQSALADSPSSPATGAFPTQQAPNTPPSALPFDTSPYSSAAEDLTTPLPYGSFHVRPVGTQRWGASRLYRSGELYDITIDEAAFLTQTLGIRTIYDIRSEFETAAHPQPYLMGAKTIALTPNWERRRKDASKRLIAGVIGNYGAPEERMCANYRRYAHEYPLIGKALRSISAEGTPALVHCVNGKDRTGVLCATALRIAGFSDEFIKADYLLTNDVNVVQIAEEESRLGRGMTAEEHAILMSFLEARPSYLAAFFDEAEAQYGSFEGFVEKGLRLTPEQVERLRRLIG